MHCPSCAKRRATYIPVQSPPIFSLSLLVPKNIKDSCIERIDAVQREFFFFLYALLVRHNLFTSVTLILYEFQAFIGPFFLRYKEKKKKTRDRTAIFLFCFFRRSFAYLFFFSSLRININCLKVFSALEYYFPECAFL